jgi:lycopene cyclase domain-containing protein
MTYTQIAVLAVAATVLVDLFVLRTGLLRRRVFWASYLIMFVFQLITNGVLTGRKVVRYDGDAIVGEDTPVTGTPPLFGEGRIAYAPVEDLLFGFALILLTLATWIWLGRRGVQREPFSGPPRWRRTPDKAQHAKQSREGGGAADQSGTLPGP